MSTEPFINYSTLKTLGVTSTGTVVREVTQSDATAATSFPSPTDSDVCVVPRNSVVALYDVILRADMSNWQTEVRLQGSVAAGTYTVTLAGTGYSVTAVGTETPTALLTAIKAQIDANAPANTYVVVVGTVDGGTTPNLTVSNGSAATDARAAFSVAVTANLTNFNDATSVTYQLLSRRGDGASARWSIFQGSRTITENTGDRLEVSGLGAIDIMITATDGRVRRAIAASVVE